MYRQGCEKDGLEIIVTEQVCFEGLVLKEEEWQNVWSVLGSQQPLLGLVLKEDVRVAERLICSWEPTTVSIMTPCRSELTSTLKHGLVSSNDPAWLSHKHNGCNATAGGVVQCQQIFIVAARLDFKVSMLPCQTIHNLLVET